MKGAEMFKNAELLPNCKVKFDIFEKSKKKKQHGHFLPVQKGTFPFGSEIIFSLQVPRVLGAFAVVLRIAHDDGPCCDLPLEYVGYGDDFDTDKYEICLNELNLPTPPEQATAKGLYFYEFLFLRGEKTLFSDTENNSDILLSPNNARRFCLLLYEKSYATPKSFYGGVIYHIFLDRFCKGKGKTELHKGATLNPDWENGTPEFAQVRGGLIDNTDFFGGNLRGIMEKLPEIQSLGVEYLYLNPIFMAYSNHRYDTCNYKRIDPMLGTEADFQALCDTAHTMGMKVILDGVFSHTGSDSIYFDRQNRFGGGALAGEASPYYGWFDFQRFPDKYTCWWGIDTLPCVKKLEPSYMDYIINDEDSVIAHWLRLGADGFRLDVVDELPTAFLRSLRRRLRELNPNALLIGEIWEDASNKIAYDVRRSYFTAGELDSVMNYPWRTAILRYCAGQDDGTGLREAIETIAENYPPRVLLCVMNFLSTHDTARALTQLADPFEGSREQKAVRTLRAEARHRGLCQLRMAMALQFVLPGMPCIYYGDEAGMEGYADPFNRRCYPWGREDTSLRQFVASLGNLRKNNRALRLGAVAVTAFGEGRIAIERTYAGQCVCLCCNQSNTPWHIPKGTLLLGGRLESVSGQDVILSPGGFAIFTPK